MEQTIEVRSEYYDVEFKAFTQTALATFNRLKPVYFLPKNRAAEAPQETLFSKAINAGAKRYCMDIKRAKAGTLCLTICETTSGLRESKETRRIVVFDSAEEVREERAVS